jgi:hypothetical protein
MRLMMVNKLHIAGDDNNDESCEFLVCIRADEPTRFTDNVFDFCCMCGVKVQLRPHAPTAPKRVCYKCIEPDLQKDADRGELEITITPRTVLDLIEHYARKKQH